MSMNQPLVADQATTSAMLNAFNACQSECQRIQGRVDSAQGQLAMVWQSDSASGKFRGALGEWMQGFQKVRRGLDLLNENMNYYSRMTAQTEDTNTAKAGSWAAG